MAETDVSHEFGREPGFSCLVFCPEHSHMLHTSSQDDTVPSVKVEESSHSINVVDKTSESVNSSIESQDISIDKMPKGNDVESTDISITESQFSSTMPYCEESLVAKLDPVGESQFLSAQPCHKEDTTFSHESAD